MSTVVMLGRLLVSLAVVLGVIWFIGRRVRGGSSGTQRSIEVLERAALSRSSSVALVRVQDRTLILGVADGGVQLLGEASTPELAQVSVVKNVAQKKVVKTKTAAPKKSPLSGSALSPQTWHQSIEALRDITSRT